MSEDKHQIFETVLFQCQKKPGKYGCVQRHPDPAGIKSKPCDYRYNGYEISKNDRRPLYTNQCNDAGVYKNFRGIAQRATKPSRETRVQREVATVFRTRKDPSKAQKFFEVMFQSPVDTLAKDPQAWDIDRSTDYDTLPKNLRGAQKPTNPKNFVPRHHGGHTCLSPYHHNHHHIIPSGAFRDYVLLAEEGLDGETVTVRRRTIAVLLSKWNINEKENVVILPQQDFISELVGLIAHCPHGLMSHKKYGESLEKELDKVRQCIDKMLEQKLHEFDEVKTQLEKLSKRILNDEIIAKQPGVNLGYHTKYVRVRGRG